MRNNQPKANILIIDDIPSNLRLLSDLLKKQGYNVRGVTDGRRALQTVHRQPPDIILLDIMMPNMDGYEVCRQLKTNEQTRDIPVIFISALHEILDKVKAFAMGGVDYITKPFQVEEVLARIETHLTLRRLQTHLEQLVVDRTRRLEEALAHQVELTRSYSRFVPSEFLSILGQDSIIEVELGDQIQTEITIVFADIRSFTALSEHMSPQENFNFLNAYLSRVGPVIRKHNGFIDKYIGDAIMALFPSNEDDALQAAIAMLKTLTTYNKTRHRIDRSPISIGLGLHTGQVMLGTVGEAERMESTVISDTVNLAARLERLTKMYGANIIVSERTLFGLERPNRYQFRFLDAVQVKGKKESVSVFEILDGTPTATMELKLKTRPDFEKGLLHYYSEEFTEAKKYFQQVFTVHPEDKAAEVYLRRIEHYVDYGVPVDWEGIEALSEK